MKGNGWLTEHRLIVERRWLSRDKGMPGHTQGFVVVNSYIINSKSATALCLNRDIKSVYMPLPRIKCIASSTLADTGRPGTNEFIKL